MKKLEKQEQAEVEQKIAALSQAVTACRGGHESGICRIPEPLRQSILALWRESGSPIATFARRVGVASGSMHNWMERERKATTPGNTPIPRVQKARKKKPAPFKRMQVVAERPPAPVKSVAVPGFEMELPSGARVRGLQMKDLLELMRAPGGAR